MPKCTFPRCGQPLRTASDLSRHYTTVHKGKIPPAPANDLDILDAAFWAGARDRGGGTGNEEHGEQQHGAGPAEAQPGTRAFTSTTHPTAGWACDSDGTFLPDHQHDPPPLPVDLELDPENPFYPFDDFAQWSWAEHVCHRRLSAPQTKELMELLLLGGGSAPFSNRDQLRKIIKRIEHGVDWAKWYKVDISLNKLPPDDLDENQSNNSPPPLPFLSETHTLYTRDTSAVLKDLLRSPAYRGNQHYAPVRHSFEDEPLITEPHTASRAWEFADELPDGHTPVRINIACDGTKASIGTGNVGFHPVYMSTSINSGWLHREHRDALVLVGFLPMLKRTSKGNDEYWRRYCRIIRHHCFTRIFEPLQALFKESQLFQMADGHYRWCRAYLGSMAVDYPEGVWLCCVLKNFVACCGLAPNELGEGIGVPRTSEQSAEFRTHGSEYARERGVHMEEPFFASINTDGHATIIADILHQLVKGVFKDITLDSLLIPYLKVITGGGARFARLMATLGRHLACMPPYPGQRRFKDGVEFSQWTGEDTKALMRILPAALYDLTSVGKENLCVLDEVVEAFVQLAIVYMLASSLESTGADRAAQKAALDRFVTLIKDGYDTIREDLGFNWVRLHAIHHYVDWIISSGVSSHSDTSASENLHIIKVKDPYRESNHCNTIIQILQANTRSDAMLALRTLLEAAGIVPYSRPINPPMFNLDHIQLGLRSRHARRKLSHIAELRDLPNLVAATRACLVSCVRLPIAGSFSSFDGLAATHSVAAASFQVYQNSPTQSRDACKTIKQQIYARNNYFHRGEGRRAPRYDTILFDNGVHDRSAGFKAFDVGRVLLFFTTEVRGEKLQLALINCYTKLATHKVLLQPQVRLRRHHDGTPVQKVVLVKSILRSVHLQPLFGALEAPAELNFMNVLDEWEGKFLVSLFSDQHIFRTMFRSL